jgi:glycerate 2-kinase
MAMTRRKVLCGYVRRGDGAASPSRCVPSHLPQPKAGPWLSGPVAAVAARCGAPIEGVMVTRYGHGAPPRTIDANHNLSWLARRLAAEVRSAKSSSWHSLMRFSW